MQDPIMTPFRGGPVRYCRPNLRRSTLNFLRVLSVVFALTVLTTSVAPLRAEERASIVRVPPAYPEMAKRMHITGTVKVVVTVDAAGSVLRAESDSGNKMLAPAAIDAVKHWKFAPGDGNATVVVQVNFGL
ncbi:TonB family protein [Granulicella sp. dw_53]|uniref:TonB family protein n=1 Tax=Granulicella sp. dw_53 TaxID=2719792 RepID=UPI001BD341B0|nr:TonB family protein [Granulicella sp. dw_53]